MLAGDVTVIDGGDVLRVIGDAQANEIEISQNELGQFVIAGVDTTINGGDGNFIASGQRFVTLVMNDGNDAVAINNVFLERQLSFFGGNGNDRLSINNVDARFLHIKGENGNDIFEVDANVRRSAYFYLGSGDDTLAVAAARTGRNFKVFGGDGNDTFVSATLSVNRKLVIEMANGNDEVVFTGATTSGRRATLDLGSGDDFVALRPAQTNQNLIFNRGTRIDLGPGNDSGELGSSLNLRRSISIDGGDGTDELSQVSSNFATRGFESSATDIQTRIDQIFANLDLQDIDSEVFSGQPTEEETTIDLVVQESALEVVGQSAAVSIDGSLTISGTENTTISQATIGIDGFVTGEDELIFLDTATISGSFDATSGVLTLVGDDTLAAYQAALRQVQYRNTSATPSTTERVIQIGVTAGEQTFTASRNLAVTTPVTGETTISPGNLTSSGSVSVLPHLVDENLSIESPATTFNQASVAIVSGLDSESDQLAVTLDFGSNIIQIFDASTGVLSLSGTATVEEYQSVLRTLTYNHSGLPAEVNRTLRYTVNDGSNDVTTDVTLSLT